MLKIHFKKDGKNIFLFQKDVIGIMEEDNGILFVTQFDREDQWTYELGFRFTTRYTERNMIKKIMAVIWNKMGVDNIHLDDILEKIKKGEEVIKTEKIL
ncbi:MAG: hypothetical protein PWQ45_116 [Thermosipho sp. (in: thermotogales)]|jgi:hypothetical protein|nr:hypothetical protein [Thermosipho sp. (in: thermotogales)]